MKKYSIGQNVWTVIDPLKGMLEYPIADKILEVPTNPPGRVLLLKTNHIDSTPYEWYNDYYGNLIETRYIFGTFAEAQQFLIGYYDGKLSQAKLELDRLSIIVYKLKRA